jgi:hypothetical protein
MAARSVEGDFSPAALTVSFPAVGGSAAANLTTAKHKIRALEPSVVMESTCPRESSG